MITIPAQIESVATRKDKTLKLTIGTSELLPNQMADLIIMNQQFCYLAIKPEHFAQNELDAIEELKTDFENQKSFSQRLRAVLFLNWKSNNKGFTDFLPYYIHMMETIIGHYKNQIDGQI
jgi:hypothetical protein